MAGRSDWVNVNGRLARPAEAQVSALDHGLLYGDGLFETLRVYNSGFFRLQQHLERLAAGARQLDLPLPCSLDSLAAAIRETVRANGVRDGIVRLTVTRGPGPPLPDPAECGPGTYMVTVRHPTQHPTPNTQHPIRNALSVTASGRHPRLFIPAIKSLCFQPFQQARVEARRLGFDDALLCDGERVVEASSSNIFLIRAGELLTPDLSSGCLAGITRAAVLEIAASLELACRECSINRRDLAACEELFLTNSGSGLVPVTAVDGRSIGDGMPGPVWRRLLDAYEALVAKELLP